MAIDSIIPRRPQAIESKIPVADKNCIEYAVVFAAKNEDAFLLFHPEYRTVDGKLNQTGKRACRDFFSYSKNREYRDAYAGYLRAFLERKDAPTATVGEIDGSRKDNALKTFVNRALTLMERGEDLDPETVKLIADIAVKLKLIKEDEEQRIKPVRVLMVRCKSECRYRAFVETQLLEGRIFDDCTYCRARAYAEEHGFKYDPCKLLDVPQDVIDELDCKNDVKLEQILQGKIEN